MLLQNSSSLEKTSISIDLNCVELINFCMKLPKVPCCTALKLFFCDPSGEGWPAGFAYKHDRQRFVRRCKGSPGPTSAVVTVDFLEQSFCLIAFKSHAPNRPCENLRRCEIVKLHNVRFLQGMTRCQLRSVSLGNRTNPGTFNRCQSFKVEASTDVHSFHEGCHSRFRRCMTA